MPTDHDPIHQILTLVDAEDQRANAADIVERGHWETFLTGVSVHLDALKNHRGLPVGWGTGPPPQFFGVGCEPPLPVYTADCQPLTGVLVTAGQFADSIRRVRDADVVLDRFVFRRDIVSLVQAFRDAVDPGA